MKTVYRYRSRHQYYPAERRYVGYLELIAWQDAGDTIKVICGKTKNDITKQVLARAKAYQTFKDANEWTTLS